MSRNVLTIFLCIALSGCTMMPKYFRPFSPVDPSWPAHSDVMDHAFSAVDIGWRNFFGDPRLQKLIAVALDNNRDLRIASLNVELVQAQYRRGQATILPTVNAMGNGLRQRDVDADGVAEDSGKYSAKLGITSYEIDLFGRLRSLKRQALEQYFATQEARNSVQITLIAQVAIQYLTERALDEQLNETKRTLASVEAYFKLIKDSYDLGNASQLDLKTAESQAQTARANVASFERQRAQAENALVLLIGGPLPASLPAPESFGSQKIMADVSEGIPSELITRRPDILEAEHQLKAANANIGAARAAFFPKITLTGSGGIASVKLTDLFSGGSVWNFAPQISMPIFDGGANAASLDMAKINKSIQVAQYEKTIQTAFKEVSDALAARAALDRQINAQQELVASQQKRYDLSDIRYRNGIDRYLNVLLAQQDLYRAQQDLIQSQLLRFSNLVTLYKALGGGWNETSSKESGAIWTRSSTK